MVHDFKLAHWKCRTQVSTGSAQLGLRRRLALCPLPLLALEGRTLLMRFTRPVTLMRRRLVWLEDLRVGEVGEPSGAAADTARRWELEAGVLDDAGVAVSFVVALVAPDATTMITHVDTDATPAAADASSWDDSKVVALPSIGAILSDFLVEKIMRLSWFAATWDMFVTHIRDTFLLDRRAVSALALCSLNRALKAATATTATTAAAADDDGLQGSLVVIWIWEKTWARCDRWAR